MANKPQRASDAKIDERKMTQHRMDKHLQGNISKMIENKKAKSLVANPSTLKSAYKAVEDKKAKASAPKMTVKSTPKKSTTTKKTTVSAPTNGVLNRMTNPSTLSASKKTTKKVAAPTKKATVVKKSSGTGGLYSPAVTDAPTKSISAKREAEIKRKASLGLKLIQPDDAAKKSYNQARKIANAKSAKSNKTITKATTKGGKKLSK